MIGIQYCIGSSRRGKVRVEVRKIIFWAVQVRFNSIFEQQAGKFCELNDSRRSSLLSPVKWNVEEVSAVSYNNYDSFGSLQIASQSAYSIATS